MPEKDVVASISRQHNARAALRDLPIFLHVKLLEWFVFWLRKRNAGHIPSRERLAIASMKEFHGESQIVRDALCLFSLLVVKQRLVVDRLRHNATAAGKCFANSGRFR